MFVRGTSSLALLIFLIMLSSCQEVHPDYKEVEDDALMKVVRIGDGEFAPGIGQHISYKVRIIGPSGEEIYKTNKLGIDKYEHLHFTHDKKGVIQRSLQHLHLGDSVSYKLSPKLLQQQFPEITIEDSTGWYGIEMSVNYVEDLAARTNRLDALINQAKLKEDKIIDDFFKGVKYKDDFEKYNGLYLKTIKPGTGKVNINDNLMLSYKAYFLDGKLFDNATDSSMIKYSFGETGQVIQGLTMVIAKLGIGSKSEIIIPSEFAFGDAGSSSEIVPPNTPLRYEFEVFEDRATPRYLD